MLIKLCGLTRATDVAHALTLGVDFCGFIFHPQSPRAVAPRHVALLPRGEEKRVGVFVTQGSAEIERIMAEADLDFAQLHGQQSIDCALRLGAHRVIRVLWPEKYASRGALQADIDRYASSCAYYLLDAGKHGGGSGRAWHCVFLEEVRFPHPWLLAGGLSRERLEQCGVQPQGFDVNSGIEDAPGIKNLEKMTEVVQYIRSMAL